MLPACWAHQPRAFCLAQERAKQVQAKHAAGAEGEFLETKKNTYDVVFMSINEPFRLVLSDVRARLQRTK